VSVITDLGDQFKSLGQRIGQQIQDSPAYMQMQDRYQSLSPSSQKMVNLFGAVLITFILTVYPMSQFFDSQSTINSFEDKRNLIRELFKTYRESSARPNIAVPPSYESLRASVASILAAADLTPEQNNGLLEGSDDGKLIPKSLVSHILEVRLSKLNIKQIVDIGANIVGISDSVKMKDISIIAHASDTRYFDVVYKLYSLNVPEPTPEPPPEVEKPKKGSTATSGRFNKGNTDKSKAGDE
jgi:hypothetical protein